MCIRDRIPAATLTIQFFFLDDDETVIRTIIIIILLSTALLYTETNNLIIIIVHQILIRWRRRRRQRRKRRRRRRMIVHHIFFLLLMPSVCCNMCALFVAVQLSKSWWPMIKWGKETPPPIYVVLHYLEDECLCVLFGDTVIIIEYRNRMQKVILRKICMHRWVSNGWNSFSFSFSFSFFDTAIQCMLFTILETGFLNATYAT